MANLFNELKRRNVVRVALAYVVVAWILIEVASVMLPGFGAPDWIFKVFAFLVVLGWPLALIFAWAFEITPEGLKRAHEVPLEHSIAAGTGRQLNMTIIGLLAVALVVSLAIHFMDWRGNDSGPTTRSIANSIAVLPFASRSTEASTTFFADGIHDDLLTMLANISSLKVISRTSVMEYKDTTKNMRDIGRELGAATILEGGIQQAGDNVRINMQLIDAETDEHLWARTYDRELTAENIFTIQSEIAESIAAQLAMTLSPAERNRIHQTPTDNLEAYNAYIKARQLYSRNTWDSLRAAAQEFQRAVDLDPEYVPARIGLARTYYHLATTGAISTEEMINQGRAHIDRAMALDPANGYAWAVLAVYRNAADADDVQEAFDRAMELSPNSPDTLETYVEYLRSIRAADRALPLIERALGLDPLSVGLFHDLGRSHVALGNFEKAHQAFMRIEEIDPGNPYAAHGAAMTTIMTGRLAEAARWSDRSGTMDPTDPENPASSTLIYLDIGNLEKARQSLDRALTLGPEQPYALAAKSYFLRMTGDEEQALATARATLAMLPDDRWRSHWIQLRIVRDAALDSGEHEEALAWYRQHMPGAFDDPPRMDATALQKGADLAHLLIASGEQAQADALLAKVIKLYDDTYSPGSANFPLGVAKAEALALQGNGDAAVAELQRVIDDGWRLLWKWNTTYNHNFESLHDRADFQALVAFIESDMARQVEGLQAQSN